jgi:hypothetical protein
MLLEGADDGIVVGLAIDGVTDAILVLPRWAGRLGRLGELGGAFGRGLVRPQT